MSNIELRIAEFEEALLHINRVKAAYIFEKAYTDEKNFEMIEKITMETLERIGAGWENGLVSLSQVYMSGVICEELIDHYLPKFEVKRRELPKMAIAVLQDYHSLGKRIVYSIVRAGGYQILDFGQGLSVEELVNKTIENEIELLLISTLMLPSALKVKVVKEKLEEAGSNTRIIVGGAPFRLDDNLWKNVGADADGKNASNILKTIEILLKGVNDAYDFA